MAEAPDPGVADRAISEARDFLGTRPEGVTVRTYDLIAGALAVALANNAHRRAADETMKAEIAELRARLDRAESVRAMQTRRTRRERKA